MHRDAVGSLLDERAEAQLGGLCPRAKVFLLGEVLGDDDQLVVLVQKAGRHGRDPERGHARGRLDVDPQTMDRIAAFQGGAQSIPQRGVRTDLLERAPLGEILRKAEHRAVRAVRAHHQHVGIHQQRAEGKILDEALRLPVAAVDRRHGLVHPGRHLVEGPGQPAQLVARRADHANRVITLGDAPGGRVQLQEGTDDVPARVPETQHGEDEVEPDAGGK